MNIPVPSPLPSPAPGRALTAALVAGAWMASGGTLDKPVIHRETTAPTVRGARRARTPTSPYPGKPWATLDSAPLPELVRAINKDSNNLMARNLLLSIAPLVFGGNVFGWTADRATSFALLDRLLDAGLTTIDTADLYSRWAPGNQGGESETLIGDWMHQRGVRERIQLITKVGSDMGDAGTGLSAAHIERAAEASLKRLRTDRIDIYFSHRPDDRPASARRSACRS